VTDLSAAEARAIMLAAQGFATPRQQTADAKAVRALVEQLGVVQIDSVTYSCGRTICLRSRGSARTTRRISIG
jgi:uncharacterized protein YcaQ